MSTNLFCFILGVGCLAFAQSIIYWRMSLSRRKILGGRDYYNHCPDCAIRGDA